MEGGVMEYWPIPDSKRQPGSIPCDTCEHRQQCDLWGAWNTQTCEEFRKWESAHAGRIEEGAEND